VLDVTLPQYGMGMEEAEIVEWLVAVGDSVVADTPLLLVETAKVETEIVAPQDGTVMEIVEPVGSVIRVGAVLARIEPAM